MSAAEGPRSGRAPGVCVPPARRRQAHRGGSQGKEPAQDGHHRHVRCNLYLLLLTFKNQFCLYCVIDKESVREKG